MSLPRLVVALVIAGAGAETSRPTPTTQLGHYGFCTKPRSWSNQWGDENLVETGACRTTWTSGDPGCNSDQYGCPSEACDGAGYDPWCMTEKGGKDDWCYCRSSVTPPPPDR